MKIFVAVLLSLMTGLPARAADISVQQLVDSVASAEARGQSDKDIARKIAASELTQRLTDESLPTLLRRPRVHKPERRCKP